MTILLEHLDHDLICSLNEEGLSVLEVWGQRFRINYHCKMGGPTKSSLLDYCYYYLPNNDSVFSSRDIKEDKYCDYYCDGYDSDDNDEITKSQSDDSKIEQLKSHIECVISTELK